MSDAGIDGRTTRVTGTASTIIAAVANTGNRPRVRSPLDRSARTASRSAVAAWLDRRVNRAVMSDTVTSECGSMYRPNACVYAALPATSTAWSVPSAADVAPDVTRDTATYPS